MSQTKVSEIQGRERVRYSVPENQLVALLHARRLDQGPGITSLDRHGEARTLSYSQLYAQAALLCAGLQDAGLKPGDRVVLQLDTPLAVLVGFWGCVLAGVVPVPLNTAPFYHRPNSQTDRLGSVLLRFGCRAVLASSELADPLLNLIAKLEVQTAVLDMANCLAVSRAPVFHSPAPSDPAAMFLTSGSTGAAKGVIQSHAAMLAMADATIQMNGFTSDDVTLNWMSMDHAGSLVFLGVMPLALGARQVHVPIEYVLKDPMRWLDLIDGWRASITWAPNFVFSLLLDREQQLKARHWDLSCMRFMVNAGEAVVSATARRFIALLRHFDLPEAALRPAFGMVETCSGITWSPGFRLQDTSDTDAFVSLGTVIPGAAMKIIDGAGASVAEGVEGRLLLKGDSVFAGYEGEAELNAHLLQDGWLVTGDLAFIRDGQLHVTGREKDVVIINGNNHYCHELEAVVAAMPHVASDCVAATGVRLVGENTESLVIFYALAPDAENVPERDVLEKSMRGELSRATGIAPRALVALQPGDFPRTEIGKIKRGQLRARFEAGEFGYTTVRRETPGPARALRESGGDTAAQRALLASIGDIWRRALGLDSIGPDETFFELGGSSLLAIQVQHELEVLLGREVSMVELFDTPTIRSMAAHFSDGGAAAPEVGAHRRDDHGPGAGDIAVIGIGCRFPGAHGPEQFWQVLENAVETISFFTPAEAIEAGLSPERAHDPAQVNAAPVLDDVEGCDLDFWKYARREAELLDPQQRVFLETAWEAFEDAGYVPGSALGRVGVYASAATNTYLQNNVYANRAWVQDNGGRLLTVNSLDGFNVMVANDKDYLPTRVSYKLDLTGPSMGIQTACSSTLVAVHEAARALRTGECDMAIAGGCALMLPQHAGHYYDEGMINSPDGHCRAYDSAAKGTIFGSGSGAVLLKRLDQARADGDAIYAVIRGSGLANDGGQKMGFTAPSMLGEYRAISRALQDAGVEADSIGFIEGHGTGTPIGDPIEVQALTRAFRHTTQRTGYCALGSVKTNIGHMGIASGIAGFIKTVLALHHRTIPATLHFREANPAMDIARTPFFVNSETRAWEAGTQPRRAGVNSLGIGGTNVHVILEEAPAPVPTPLPTRVSGPGVHVLPVSAANEAALRARLVQLADFIARHPQVPLTDICFTQQGGRMAMASRHACVFTQREQLLSQLDPATVQPAMSARDAGIVFMFTGQGSQYAGMGRLLHETQPVFREVLEAVTDMFSTQREHSVLGLLLAAPDDTQAQALLNQTLYTQPALFCLQVALVQLYRSYGIEPEFIVGHSIGEVAGVWASGGLSLEDAAQLVEVRSRMMQEITTCGAMASVKADTVTVRELLASEAVDCEIAACNSPFDTTLTGDTAAITAACACLQRHGLQTTVLSVSHAFHSRHMEAMQGGFESAIDHLSFSKPAVPVFANVDALPLDGGRHSASYWAGQLRAPVLFMQGLQQAVAAGGRCFVEIGPASILCSLGRALDPAEHVRWVPSLRKGQADDEVFANALATLFVSGHDVDWSALPVVGGNRIHLPTYPWQRQRCWIEPDATAADLPQVDPLLARPLVLPRLGQQVYTLDYSVATVPVLAEHRVFGGIVPPAALYVSQLLRTAADVAGQRQVVLSDVNFVAPMHVDEDSGSRGRTVQILFMKDAGAVNIELSSQPKNLRLEEVDERAVQVHVKAGLLTTDTAAPADKVDLAAIRKRCSDVLDPRIIEAHMRMMQVDLGESFLCFGSISRGRDEALALLDVPVSAASRLAQGIPAGLIDCHWQTILAALPALPAATVVPSRIETLVCHGHDLPAQVWAHAALHRHSDKLIVASVTLFRADGERLLESRDIELRAVDAAAFRHAALQPRAYSRRWEPLALRTDTPPTTGDILVAGPSRDAGLLVAQLGSAGLTPRLVADIVDLRGRAGPCTLIYVDRIETADGRSSAALNAFLAALEPETAAITQVLVVTTLGDSSTAALAIAERAALAVQAVSAAHEITGLTIRAVEMDDDPRSVQTFLLLLGVAADSGQRIRISAGVASIPRADAVQPGPAQVSFAPERLQVITGGLGGLGLLTAQWMVQRGARLLLLAGRSAPTPQADGVIAALRAAGAHVEVYRCDVSRSAGVHALAAAAARIAPVETLIHAAGARRDGLIGSLQDEDFSALARVKPGAAVDLHEAFASLQPRRTIYYSSVAGWLGAAAQSNYAAANAALDALAVHYGSTGKVDPHGGHVISVAWGPWRDTGMTAELNESQLARIGSTGYGFLEPDTGFGLLGRLLADTPPGEICIMAGDTARLATLPGATAFWTSAQVGSHGLRSSATAMPIAGPVVPVLAHTIVALDENAAWEMLQDHLAGLVSQLTGPSRAAHVDVDAGFFDLGVDSLAALELRRKLEAGLGLKLRSTIILDYPSIATMARALVAMTVAAHGNERDTLAAVVTDQKGPLHHDTPALSRSDLLRQLASEIDLQENA